MQDQHSERRLGIKRAHLFQKSMSDGGIKLKRPVQVGMMRAVFSSVSALEYETSETLVSK